MYPELEGGWVGELFGKGSNPNKLKKITHRGKVRVDPLVYALEHA